MNVKQVKDFGKMYVALLETLNIKYGKSTPAIKAAYAAARVATGLEMEEIGKTWTEQLTTIQSSIETRDAQLMAEGKTSDGIPLPPVLEELKFKKIFADRKLSDLSRDRIWQYLAELKTKGKLITAPVADTDEDVEITAPSDYNQNIKGAASELQGIAKLASVFPPTVMEKVFTLAKGYQEQGEDSSGETKPLDLSTVLSDVMAQLTSDDMNALIGNIGSSLKKDSGSNTPDLEQVLEAMRNMTSQ